MAVGLGVGLVAGLTLRSRWALLLAPAAHVAAIELTRLPVAGPTVDAIRLDTAFGVLTLLLGRGFHGLVGLLPMLLGASLGAAIARRKAGQPRPRRLGAGLRRAVAALTALGLVALAALITLPASTPPILAADGQPVPGSIAELTTVRLGGMEQAILIRAHSPDRPVLLYLSGGPGQSDLGWSRVYFSELTQDFVVVGWDQRGAGKSYAARDRASTWTLEQAVSDTVELTNYLRARFGEEKIYLMGESWGTVLGVLAVQRHPELYHAWIGSGQMVSPHETDRRLYHDLLAYAERSGDTALARRMQSYREPPYADVYAYGVVMGYYDALYRPYTPPRAYLERGQAALLFQRRQPPRVVGFEAGPAEIGRSLLTGIVLATPLAILNNLYFYTTSGTLASQDPAVSAWKERPYGTEAVEGSERRPALGRRALGSCAAGVAGDGAAGYLPATR